MRAQFPVVGAHYAEQLTGDCDLNERHSITTAMAGQRATRLTIISCLWIGMLVLMREAFTRAPMWFLALFWLVGLTLGVCAIIQWRERLRAGGATLRLSQNPVPLGVPSQIAVEFARQPAIGDWRAKVRVTHQLLSEEDPKVVWGTEVAIAPPVGRHATFTLQLPVDLPDTVGGSREESVGCELQIIGPHGEWSFRLATRPAPTGRCCSDPGPDRDPR